MKAFFVLAFILASFSFGNAQGTEVLQDILFKVTDVKGGGGELPVIIFDLDDTLVSTPPRTFAILRDFVKQLSIKQKYPVSARLLENARLSQIRYELDDTMRNLKITETQFIEDAKKFWQAGFFSNAYCADDKPVLGGSSYVRSAFRRGAHIVYLTGRKRTQMLECTTENLKQLGLPLGKRATLVMHPGDETSVLQFKEEAFRKISALGEVIAGFENEPENVNAMAKSFPHAQMVFLDTIHSNKPTEPNPEIPWVIDYRME
jgi:hypothetical protein